MSDATPSTLETLAYPWQQGDWQRVKQLLSAGRLPHALLLSGPAGVGKLRFGRAFASLLLCESPQQVACGQCRSCQLLASGSHPDFREIAPEEGKRQIAIDQVRTVQQFAAQHAHREGGRKLILLHPAEAMNHFTANALLKTLEEPAGTTVLLLLSHAPSLLLPTIRSRCLQMSLAAPEPAAARQWLGQQLGDAELADTLLSQTGGSPLAARALYETDTWGRWQEFDVGLDNVIEQKMPALQLAEKQQEVDAELVLDWWANRLMAVNRHLLAGDKLPGGGWERWHGMSPTAVYELLDDVVRSRSQIRRGVVLNKRLLCESLILRALDLLAATPA
ncbi:DNA polymerase III subunit delta' [Spongiibacter nanhainus]|uniref:DNA-directed DNA polymerase n=1 Tax=Spongiibacter nanhainus TaxID=2794344 RepID=A0A7T4URU8_9GAMM|nr:DNA polymerase III subunit delta' [Spongiibacter nanhainus]QQD19882.1 DNA polymerase III subunit delta' [Spongiibacter nanhainus]